uniref:Uncharacterized protein n=1 Tax=uncultured marine thaumarchaeote KM3_54_G11 TaxID=1456193 RepID=A0A075H6V5_9ARCH|nr:hypothetical protein [uncultured marine thaumarchaeote KM3_54_G11]
MGDPLRIRPNRRSSSRRSSRPGSSFANWSPGPKLTFKGSTNTGYVEDAFARQSQLQQLGIDTLEEDDLHKLVDDPGTLQRFKALLSDEEIREMFGMMPEQDVSLIRADKNLTDIARPRVQEYMKQWKEGKREVEGDKKRHKFIEAFTSVKDYLHDETLLGKAWDGIDWVSDKVTPDKIEKPMDKYLNAGWGIGKVGEGFDKMEELVRRHNARADALRQKHGADSTMEMSEELSEWSFKKRLLTTIPRLTGLMDSPGMEGYDSPTLLTDPKRWWQESNLFIPFLESQMFGAQVVRDLADMGIGSEEGNKQFFKRAKEIEEETGDFIEANLTAWREREDIGAFTKEGILLGADPTVVAGVTLGATKALTGGARAAKGFGSAFADKWAWRRLDPAEQMKLRDTMRQNIKAGEGSDYWVNHPGELGKYIDELVETEEAAVRASIDDELFKETGQTHHELIDAQAEIVKDNIWLDGLYRSVVDDVSKEYRAGGMEILLDEGVDLTSEFAEDMLRLVEDGAEAVAESAQPLSSKLTGYQLDIARNADEQGFFIDQWSEELRSAFNDKVDFSTSPLYTGKSGDVDEWASWLSDLRTETLKAEKVAAKEYEKLQEASRKYTDATYTWTNSGIHEFKADLTKRANDIKSGFWDDHAEKLEDLLQKELDGRDWRIVKVADLAETDDILSMVKPRTHRDGLGFGKLRRFFDPSSEIQNYAKGSMDRTLLEGMVIVGRIQDMGSANTSRMVNELRTLGNWRATPYTGTLIQKRAWMGARKNKDRGLFEIYHTKTEPKRVYDADQERWVWEVDAYEGRLEGIVPKRGHKGASLHYADVFSIKGKGGKTGREVRNEIYSGITEKQHDAIDALQHAYEDLLELARKEGIDINDLGSLEEGLAYIARKAKGQTGTQELMRVAGRMSKPGFTKTRFYKEMAAGVLSGKQYYDPLETFEYYSMALHNHIAEERLRKHILAQGADWVKDVDIKTAAPDIAKKAENATKNLKAQEKSLSLVGKFAGGYTLTTAERKAVLASFPELSGKLQDMFNIERSLTWERAQKELFKTLRRAGHKYTAQQIRAAIQAVRASGGQNRSWMQKTDVENVLLKLFPDTVGDADRAASEAYDVLHQAQQGERKLQELRAKDLQKEMIEVMKGSEAYKDEAVGLRRVTQEGLRTAGHGEGRASSMNLIFQGPESDKIANRLDQFLTGQGYPVLQFASNAADAIRIMKTGMDFGVFFIQGLPLLFRNAEHWGKAMGWSLQAMVDDGARAAYIANNSNEIVDMVRHGGHLGSTEITESMSQGGWLAKLAVAKGDTGNIAQRGLGKLGQAVYQTTKRFSTQYDMFLDVARVETYKALKPTILRHGSDGDLYDLADFVNKLSGHTSSRALGIGVTQRQIENALFLFSPRYTRATASLFLDMTRGGLRGREARSALAGLMAGQYALHMAISAARGEEPNLIPGRGDWLKTNIPGIGHVGFGGKSNAIINMVWDIQDQAMTNPDGFLSINVFDKKTYDDNSFLRRLRYQTSPLSGAVLNYITGADPIGRELPDWEDIYHDDLGNRQFDMGALWTKLRSIGLEHLPFAVEGLAESGPVGFGAEWFGGQVMPERPYEVRDDLFDKYARQDLGLSLRELRKRNDYQTLKAQLENDHPELKRASDNARESEKLFGRNEERMLVRETRDIAIRELATDWNLAAKEFNSIGGSGRQFRERFWEANKVYGGQMRSLREAHPRVYADMTAYYEGKGETSQVQAATNAFMDRLFSADAQDFFGKTNYAAIDRIKSEIRQTWGDEIMDEVEKNFTVRMKERARGLDGEVDKTVLEFIDSIEGLRDYWEVGRNLARNEEEWRLWLAYENANEPTKELMRKRQYKLGRINFSAFEKKIDTARERMQKTNPDVDRWLILFYGKDPLHRQNK